MKEWIFLALRINDELAIINKNVTIRKGKLSLSDGEANKHYQIKITNTIDIHPLFKVLIKILLKSIPNKVKYCMFDMDILTFSTLF